MDGFNLGEDNCIKNIEIRNGALRFEISSILRPGRFLGNHYLAFTVPNRTFIITLDRVLEGMRAARRSKRHMHQAVKEALMDGAPTADKSKLSGDGAAGSGAAAATTKDVDHLRFAEPENKLQRLPSPTIAKPSKESFFSRFVRGYMGASSMSAGEREEEWNKRLTAALSEWFGRQEVRRGKGAGEENDFDEEKDDDVDEDELVTETIGALLKI